MTRPARPRTRPAAGQRGAAILLAMLILALVATLAAGMIWQQWRGIEVESAERARSEGEWLLNGALDWARVILRSDARAGNIDHLGEPWAMPLAESRLSDFLSTDTNHSDDSAPEAFLSGQISDANARYNLYPLYASTTNAHGELLKLEALCTAIGVPTTVADTLSTGLSQSWTTLQDLGGHSALRDASEALLMPDHVADLVRYGVDPAAVHQLARYLVFLPASTKVNVNTASAEVLMAAMPGITRAGAQAVVERRAQKPFSDINDAENVAGYQPPAAGSGTSAPTLNIDVRSDWFEVYGQLRYEQHVLRERSLVHRIGLNQVDVVRRERLSPEETP